ncbi:hypothetical protein LOD99_12408 [Oopsacas minuta]|uniref:Uncharacterized protein n=1 Tax=Oopsacas minuta TaxID=111878 RepID=A0AAV7JF61_9METZ|nr:hypothetical protein LOD99_12408 [Oopsacas minuta]
MEEELALTGVLNGEHYLIDTDVPCFEEAQNFDKEIINEIVSKKICLDDYPEDVDVDDEFVQPIITHQVADSAFKPCNGTSQSRGSLKYKMQRWIYVQRRFSIGCYQARSRLHLMCSSRTNLHIGTSCTRLDHNTTT